MDAATYLTEQMDRCSDVILVLLVQARSLTCGKPLEKSRFSFLMRYRFLNGVFISVYKGPV
jgi:hypothetical protein